MNAYVIRLAEVSDLAALPSVERRAARLFDGWLTERDLTVGAEPRTEVT